MLRLLYFENRFGIDQVPLELNRRDFTLDPDFRLRISFMHALSHLVQQEKNLTRLYKGIGLAWDIREQCQRSRLQHVLAVCLTLNLKLRKMRAKSLRRKRKSCRKSSERTQHPGPDMALKSFQRGGQDRKSPALTMTRPWEEFRNRCSCKNGQRNMISPFLSKKRQNGLNFTSTTTKTLTATHQIPLMNLIKLDTNSVTKIAVFCFIKQL